MDITSKELTETNAKSLSESPLGKSAEGKTFGKPTSEYDSPLGKMAEGKALNNPVADSNDGLDEIKITVGEEVISSVDKKELEEAKKIVKESILFIKENATTEAEKITAETLETMAKEDRIVIVDTSQRIGLPAYGYFYPEHDQKTGKDVSCIYLDCEALIAYGKDEAIDTITHEAYHAAQHKQGHKNDCVEEETRAWNIGLEMSNRYREEMGEYIAQEKPYTQSDIEDKGYPRDLGEGVFTEISRSNTEELA